MQDPRKQKMVKTFVVCLTISIFVAVHYIPPMIATDVTCIDDFFHNNLAGSNEYFIQ